MAYGFVIVTVVVGVGVGEFSGGGVNSPAVSTGGGGGATVGFSSVVEIGRVVVVVVGVVVRGADVVVRTTDGTDSGLLWFCELSAVCITAHTRIANSSRAATPEAYTSVCSRLSGSTRSDSTDRRQWGNPQSPGTPCRGW